MKKLLAVTIFILLFGVSVIPSTGNLVKKNNSPIELIIDGPSYGKVGESLEYFLILTGPEGFEVWFFIDWDDGSQTDWFGPFITGEYALASHIWNECGVYTIQVTAKCNGSYYNASLEVTISYMNVIGVTVYEAWELLNDTSNGIQIPIDIRYDEEWNEGFIDTPYPENAVHYPLDWFKNESTLQIFFDLYEDKEIVPYGTGGYRLIVMLYLLCEANYTGTIYHWMGGITEWLNAGLPVRNNTEPNKPNIAGPNPKKPDVWYTLDFNAVDTDGDYIKYIIDWGDNNSDTSYFVESGINVPFAHAWDEVGTYILTVKVQDVYGAFGPEVSKEIIIQKNKALTNTLLLKLLNKLPLLNRFLDILR
jgi:rhodanese-related sulfurtransferase